MKIFQFTDLHIDRPDVFPLGINTRQNFLRLLDHIKKCEFDALIISGDLCHQVGSAEIYDWIFEQLSSLQVPVFVISGNHDDSQLLAEAGNISRHLCNHELFFKWTHPDGEILFLDTSLSLMSSVQWQWLEEQVKQADNNIIIVMHHPPVLCMSKHMEPRYQFEQMDTFEELCSAYNNIQFQVFCGHYHMERMVKKNNLTVFITPSTFIQIDPSYADFTPLNALIGYREIVIERGVCIISNVVYF